jgi:hypothetical protein
MEKLPEPAATVKRTTYNFESPTWCCRAFRRRRHRLNSNTRSPVLPPNGMLNFSHQNSILGWRPIAPLSQFGIFNRVYSGIIDTTKTGISSTNILPIPLYQSKRANLPNHLTRPNRAFLQQIFSRFPCHSQYEQIYRIIWQDQTGQFHKNIFPIPLTQSKRANLPNHLTRPNRAISSK